MDRMDKADLILLIHINPMSYSFMVGFLAQSDIV